VNRDTGSNSHTTDENNTFNLTPEVMQTLCKNSVKVNDENQKLSLPPKGNMQFNLSNDSTVSFKNKMGNKVQDYNSKRESLQCKLNSNAIAIYGEMSLESIQNNGNVLKPLAERKISFSTDRIRKSGDIGSSETESYKRNIFMRSSSSSKTDKENSSITIQSNYSIT